LVLTAGWVRETLPWVRAEAARHPAGLGATPTTWEVFARMTWRDRRLAALCQAGLVEKFVDALVWVILPIYLTEAGVGLAGVGWIVGTYALVWGASQLVTGRLSDLVGRRWPNVGGMWLCGGGVALFVLGEGEAWWTFAAAVTGLGMALLYPNLSAAVADAAPAAWRGSAIGIYRFWRDLGYAVGAVGLAVAAQATGALEAAFWFVAAAMLASGSLLWAWSGEVQPSKQQVG